ncbi:LURP-one-related/scramblase family protein [Streptomyces beijiangensis]|uniref:LURP-one-related family protein n=1 Tax=Streptomyces beijiangensis TaxID=163361 RepID=A0A939FB40_9ACTN|nr:LURP-one-related family protein [Streptomyces beijiangensis]MBO0515347.1 LURP-one-related family protein [Streptomyces beijiangensis]
MKFLVRDRIFDIGDDYWIEDENGDKAFLVDGKVLRLRDTLEIKDRSGRVLITIKEKMLSIRDAMTLERDDEELATVRKKKLSLLRNHYRVKLNEGTELDVSGKILDREFTIEYDGELLAHISRKWFRVRETYAVNVVREDTDIALMIAVAVCVIHMDEKEDGHGAHGEG